MERKTDRQTEETPSGAGSRCVRVHVCVWAWALTSAGSVCALKQPSPQCACYYSQSCSAGIWLHFTALVLDYFLLVWDCATQFWSQVRNSCIVSEVRTEALFLFKGVCDLPIHTLSCLYICPGLFRLMYIIMKYTLVAAFVWKTHNQSAY